MESLNEKKIELELLEEKKIELDNREMELKAIQRKVENLQAEKDRHANEVKQMRDTLKDRFEVAKAAKDAELGKLF